MSLQFLTFYSLVHRACMNTFMTTEFFRRHDNLEFGQKIFISAQISTLRVHENKKRIFIYFFVKINEEGNRSTLKTLRTKIDCKMTVSEGSDIIKMVADIVLSWIDSSLGGEQGTTIHGYHWENPRTRGWGWSTFLLPRDQDTLH